MKPEKVYSMNDELETERKKRMEAERELALLKEKKPLNYYEIMPGFRIKKWFVIALVDAACFWLVIANVDLTENQGWMLFLACAIGPAAWMTWMSKLTGIEYFDD